MEISIVNLDNKEVGKTSLPSEIFGKEKRDDILFRVIHWQMAKARSGCHKTKQRNEVSGSTRKIYRQKGTGQARHGSIKAPVFIGGGIVFGPVVRSHAYSLNKKIRKLALKIALSVKHATNSLVVLDSANIETSKTKLVAGKISSFSTRSTLVIDASLDSNFAKSCANIKGVDTLPVCGLNVLDIIKHDKLIVTVEALSKIQERLA